jgi:hypothetical protein
MDNFQSVLGNAAGDALCNVLSAYGNAAPLLTAINMVAPTPVGGTAAVASGLAGLAAATACSWDPRGEGPPGNWGYTGCQAFAEGYGIFYARWVQDKKRKPVFEYKEIVGFGTEVRDGNAYYLISYVPKGGGEIRDSNNLLVSQYYELQGESAPGSTCATPAPPVPQPTPDPYTHTDPDSGCSLTVNFKGWGMDQAGGASGIWQIEPAAELRTGGGIIGGCNFEPVIYVDDGTGGGGGSGGGGNRPWAPVLPDMDPEEGWKELAREIVAGTVGAIVAKTLNDLFETPYQGTTYRLVSVCEKDASGEPISEAVETVIPSLKYNDAVLTRLDALVPLLQGQKNFKQPICKDRPKLEGDWRSISFRSEQTSPFGKSRLRKRFRYRSLSGLGLEQLVDYWADFSFEAGPVIVIHKGGSWGNPQVWASSIDEGKRVIRHAAGEAGIDPDQVGEWIVTGSSSARYGVNSTMKVDTTGGYYWITERDGSNGRPIVARL